MDLELDGGAAGKDGAAGKPKGAAKRGATANGKSKASKAAAKPKETPPGSTRQGAHALAGLNMFSATVELSNRPAAGIGPGRPVAAAGGKR